MPTRAAKRLPLAKLLQRLGWACCAAIIRRKSSKRIFVIRTARHTDDPFNNHESLAVVGMAPIAREPSYR